MSGEKINDKPNIATYMAFPAITTGLSATKATINARGVPKAIKLQNHEGFRKLANSIDSDVFTKSIKLSEEYEKHKTLVKNYNKWNNKLNAFNKNKKLSITDRIFNKFRKTELTEDIIRSNFDKADKALIKANRNISAGKFIDKADDALDAVQDASNIAKTGLKAGFKNNIKTLFKKEMTSKFNMVITALSHVPKIFSTVIPTFKEKGFIAGVKEAGKVVIQAGTDFVSYGLGGAIGRTIGGLVGTVIMPGVGSGIGATVGDMIGSMFVGGKITKAVDKVIGAEEKSSSSIEQTDDKQHINTEQQRLLQKQAQRQLRQALERAEENKLYMNM